MKSGVLTLIKTALVIVAFLLQNQGIASDPVRGLVKIGDEGRVTLLSIETGEPILQLVPQTFEVKKIFQKLETGDLVSGMGHSCEARFFCVDNIEYVGLKKILGTWKGKDEVWDFTTFEDLDLYLLNPDRNELAPPSLKKQLYYTITPSSGSQNWKVFLADQNSVALASLVLDKDSAVVTLIDPKTGQPQKITTLQKTTPVQ